MDTNEPQNMTLQLLLHFVAPALKTKKIMTVFEDLYPGLNEHCHTVTETLENREMTSMERLLFVSTAMFVIGLMQEILDPNVSTEDLTDLDDISIIDPLTQKYSYINPTLN